MKKMTIWIAVPLLHKGHQNDRKLLQKDRQARYSIKKNLLPEINPSVSSKTKKSLRAPKVLIGNLFYKSEQRRPRLTSKLLLDHPLEVGQVTWTKSQSQRKHSMKLKLKLPTIWQTWIVAQVAASARVTKPNMNSRSIKLLTTSWSRSWGTLSKTTQSRWL